MSDTQEGDAVDEFKPALDELMKNMIKVNECLTETAAVAIRMQMLALEDAQNMITEIGATIRAASDDDND